MLRLESILIFLGMFLATYSSRWLPLFVFSQRKLPRWFIDWLELIPAAILSALLFPELFTSGSPPHLELFQLKAVVALPTVLVAFFTRSLGATVLVGMLLFWLIGKVL